jgi:hypothetical protein
LPSVYLRRIILSLSLPFLLVGGSLAAPRSKDRIDPYDIERSYHTACSFAFHQHSDCIQIRVCWPLT